MSWRLMCRSLLYFVLAVLAASLLGSIIQTQFNLASIAALGGEVPLALWLATTLEDVVGFGPLYAGMMAVALLPALLVAALVWRLMPGTAPGRREGLRLTLYALAGAVGIFAAFQLANMAAPMPTLIAATRGVGGTLAMMLSGALGGWVFARLHSLDQPRLDPPPA
ncbi:hypothetical protein [Isoalcanivorax indicus]|uniref:hypothetical protein n=1 Tax=Isoalcanivorax indicus TaxID=2202653 RepID=UPI000DB96482|nr:hypothetical protein [Isoalcanivorax indicus]